MSQPKRQRRPEPGRSLPVTEQEIIEGLRTVCVCKGIRQRAFLTLIRAGASTVQELQKATGAGSGSCKGKRCTPRIEELLRQSRSLGEKRERSSRSHQ